MVLVREVEKGLGRVVSVSRCQFLDSLVHLFSLQLAHSVVVVVVHLYQLVVYFGVGCLDCVWAGGVLGYAEREGVFGEPLGVRSHLYLVNY